jgi:hypothetical protein
LLENVVPKEDKLAKVVKSEDRLTRVEKSIERMEKALMREIEARDVEEAPLKEFESELRDRDYRSHLTMGMTLGDPRVIARMSDIGSPQFMACIVGWQVDGEFMSPMFDRPRVINLDHMVSKDRKGREESRDILKGQNYVPDQFGGIYNSGPQILRKELLKNQEEAGDE